MGARAATVRGRLGGLVILIFVVCWFAPFVFVFTASSFFVCWFTPFVFFFTASSSFFVCWFTPVGFFFTGSFVFFTGIFFVVVVVATAAAVAAIIVDVFPIRDDTVPLFQQPLVPADAFTVVAVALFPILDSSAQRPYQVPQIFS